MYTGLVLACLVLARLVCLYARDAEPGLPSSFDPSRHPSNTGQYRQAQTPSSQPNSPAMSSTTASTPTRASQALRVALFSPTAARHAPVYHTPVRSKNSRKRAAPYNASAAAGDILVRSHRRGTGQTPVNSHYRSRPAVGGIPALKRSKAMRNARLPLFYADGTPAVNSDELSTVTDSATRTARTPRTPRPASRLSATPVRTVDIMPAASTPYPRLQQLLDAWRADRACTPEVAHTPEATHAPKSAPERDSPAQPQTFGVDDSPVSTIGEFTEDEEAGVGRAGCVESTASALPPRSLAPTVCYALTTPIRLPSPSQQPRIDTAPSPSYSPASTVGYEPVTPTHPHPEPVVRRAHPATPTRASLVPRASPTPSPSYSPHSPPCFPASPRYPSDYQRASPPLPRDSPTSPLYSPCTPPAGPVEHVAREDSVDWVVECADDNEDVREAECRIDAPTVIRVHLHSPKPRMVVIHVNPRAMP